MFAQNKKISTRQLQALLLLYFLGTALLFLPAELAEVAGTGAWIVAVIWGVVSAIITLPLIYLGKQVPNYTAVEWYGSCFGKWVGRFFALGLGGKLLFDGAMELRIFCELVGAYMLPETPVWLLMVVLLLLCAFSAKGGEESSGRTAEILFYVVFIPLVVVLIGVALSAKYGRVLPIEMPTMGEFWKGGVFFSPIFQGLTILLFIFPYLDMPEKSGKRVFFTCMVATLSIGALVFLSLAVYGEDVLAQKLLPTLQMMERVSFTGIFLSRQDVLLLWFWMASVFLFVTGILFLSTTLCIRLGTKEEEKKRKWIYILMPILLAIALLPQDLSMAYTWRLKIAPWLNGIFLVLLPISIVGIHAIKRRVSRG